MEPDIEGNKTSSSLDESRQYGKYRNQHMLPWIKWLAIGLTVVSCLSYSVIYSLVSSYQLQLADMVRELPIHTRIILNIFQPFLVVFITISLSLLVLFYLRIKGPQKSCMPFLVLIIFNGLFASILLGVTFLEFK